MKSNGPRYWAVIPSAGIGRRMGGDIPKQYQQLAGSMVIEHTLRPFIDNPRISAIVIVTSMQDNYWQPAVKGIDKQIIHATGGDERCHSVFNGLSALSEMADSKDWVLVHDAARPCLRSEDLEKLLDMLHQHPVGGLLGIPVRDTMKRADSEGNVFETIDRRELWHAATPQMFRYGLLKKALQAALDDNIFVTDEAAAIELWGEKPHMVECYGDNIKITRPEDLSLAEFYLSTR